MPSRYEKEMAAAAKRRKEIVRLHRTGRFSYAQIGAKLVPTVSKQRVHAVLRKEGEV